MPASSKQVKEKEANTGGHWAQMKAMIQMAPRKSLIDETIFDEASVERAALEMEVDLHPSGRPDSRQKANSDTIASGLGCLPLVLYFMRAPLPYPFKES